MPGAAVGLDLDGTLFDHRRSAVVGLGRFLGDLGVDVSDVLVERWFAIESRHFESWRRGIVDFQGQRRQRLLEFLPLAGLEPAGSPSALDELFDEYLVQYRAAWTAFPEAASFLRELRERGMRIGVLTNGVESQQRAKLEAVGLASLIDVLCTSEVIGVAKPDPRAFRMLAERLGVRPADVVFIGDDHEKDVEGALAAGMRAGLVLRGGIAQVGLREALAAATEPSR